MLKYHLLIRHVHFLRLCRILYQGQEPMELGHDQQGPVQRVDQGVHPSLELEIGFEDGSDPAGSEEGLDEGGCLGRG